MTRRFICPHCHSPVDPHVMDMAFAADVIFRICPFCDGPVLLAPCDAETDGWLAQVRQPCRVGQRFNNRGTVEKSEQTAAPIFGKIDQKTASGMLGTCPVRLSKRG